jgi:hypothetical protein
MGSEQSLRLRIHGWMSAPVTVALAALATASCAREAAPSIAPSFGHTPGAIWGPGH